MEFCHTRIPFYYCTVYLKLHKASITAYVSVYIYIRVYIDMFIVKINKRNLKNIICYPGKNIQQTNFPVDQK